MKAIVFGGNGFLGRYIVKELISRNFKVTVFDTHTLKKKHTNKFNFIKGDIENKNKVINAIKGQDIVYHLAGISDIGDAMISSIKTSKTNIIGTLNILEGCIKYKIKRFIFSSTIYVLSKQGGFYKASKQSAELFIEEYNKIHNLNFTIIRFGSIYGKGADPRNGISKLINSALNKKNIIYGGTNLAIRRFLHVKDAAIASVNILKKKYQNKSFLITGNKNIKIVSLITFIKKLLKNNKKVYYKRKPLMGHYDKSPFTYKPRITRTITIKPTLSLKAGIEDLIYDIREKK